MFVKEIKEDDKLDQIFLLKKFEIKSARNGKNYADLLLSDRSGDIPAKLWDVTQAEPQDLSAGDFALIRASAEKYNGTVQLIVLSAKKTKPTEEDLQRLIETAPYPAMKMYEKIVELLQQIENGDIRSLSLCLFEREKERLLYYPAAKNFHHAMRGGLLYHVYSMFRCALPLLDVYDFLNRDLVYAGIALHDIGKLDEMISDDNGIVSDYSEEGKLLGHITTTICSIDAAARELNTDPEVALLLKHMVLSHHYTPEFGSPKPPMFPEAEMLHYLDVLDSRMNQMKKTVDSIPENSFAERVWILDNRTIYHHSMNHKENLS